MEDEENADFPFMKSILSAGGSARCYKQRLHSLPTEVLFQSDRGFVSPEQSFCSNRTKPPSHSNGIATIPDRNSVLLERASA
ncbi:hypothetical protein [Bacteroides pyogenes]|uniref:hypothetical protein n=1 Tax=Bacteroides pyogenes TaxID=310300 RepID=UPI002FD88BC3